MAEEVECAAATGDSVGGVAECRALGGPVDLREPLFDSVESCLSHAMFSIPAVKAIEFGAGFRSAQMRGSAYNDPYTVRRGHVVCTKNDAGGILGGLTTGMPVVFRVAIRPTPSISVPQRTVDLTTRRATGVRVRGRHDPCIVPCAVPVVEAMAAAVFADLVLQAHQLGPRCRQQ